MQGDLQDFDFEFGSQVPLMYVHESLSAFFGFCTSLVCTYNLRTRVVVAPVM